MTAIPAPSGVEVPDEDLVRLARAGDMEAFGELVERHRRAVFRAALACVRSPAEAEDVTQDAFVAAFRKLEAYRGEAQFRTWLLAIAWRKGLDRRRGVVRWLRLTGRGAGAGADEERADDVEQLPALTRSQEEAVIDEDLQRALRRLIATLPGKLRDVLLLAGTAEHTYEEIGAMLGVPSGTVKWRASEARRILRLKLSALGYGHD